jgi:hypothetical protein
LSFLVNFARFWYDFIVGDDWTIAVAVVVALVLTSLLVRTGIAAWWLLPVIVLVFLGASVWRASRPRQ